MTEKPDQQNAPLMEDLLRKETVGLVPLDEFKRKREHLLQERQKEAVALRERQQLRAEGRLKKRAKLSFDEGLDEEEEEKTIGKGAGSVKKVGKDKTINTSFLPDREREHAEQMERKRLREEWILEQTKVRLETVEIPFVYYEGNTFPGKVCVQKAETIATFLDRARRARVECKGKSSNEMVLVIEDIIVPHHYDFYYFLLHQTRTKRGLLLDVDRLEERQSVTRVIESKYFEKNKNFYPFTAYHQFNPEIDYTTYVNRDKEGNPLWR